MVTGRPKLETITNVCHSCHHKPNLTRISDKREESGAGRGRGWGRSGEPAARGGARGSQGAALGERDVRTWHVTDS